jgi:hypothetical protein
MLAVLSGSYSPWNWRIIIPSIFGLIGMSMFFFGGQAEDAAEAERDPNYPLYHSLWHLFMSIAALVIVWTPVDFSQSQQSYVQVYKNFYKNSNKSVIS